MLAESARLSKYLSSTNNTNSWLISTIKTIYDATEPLPVPFQFISEPILATAKHNYSILEQYNLNYRRAVQANKSSTIKLGSEFRGIDCIQSLWNHRFDWKKIKQTIHKGIKYSLKPDNAESTRLFDLKLMKEQGNHPSANNSSKRHILREN